MYKYTATNTRKSAQLGMPFGTANARLRKIILFKYVALAGHDVCYQCGKRIESALEMSIEHKKPWLDVNAELYWDLENISFSHLTCNIKASGSCGPKPRSHGLKAYNERGCRCEVCCAAKSRQNAKRYFSKERSSAA